jgi:hypothetical protein
MTKRKKKPYFHNNVEAIREAPAEYFPPLAFDILMDAKDWCEDLPATVLCVIREQKSNGKIKEHMYQRGYAANRKIQQLIAAGHEFTIIDHAGPVQHYKSIIPEYDDPLA